MVRGYVIFDKTMLKINVFPNASFNPIIVRQKSKSVSPFRIVEKANIPKRQPLKTSQRISSVMSKMLYPCPYAAAGRYIYRVVYVVFKYVCLCVCV